MNINKQTAKLIARISENLPDMDSDVIQGWIDNPKGLQKVLKEALCPPDEKKLVSESTRSWREENGVIYFSVESDGTTGEEWIKRLESKGLRIGDYTKSMLCSKGFRPTKGVTYEIAVLKGILFGDNDRITLNIRVEADNRKFTKPNAEVACLIREMFSDKDLEAMELWWIVAMHEPIKDSAGDPTLLSASRDVDGRWLLAYCGKPVNWWRRGSGFAFVVSQVSI
jgi:hypothetical protein